MFQDAFVARCQSRKKGYNSFLASRVKPQSLIILASILRLVVGSPTRSTAQGSAAFVPSLIFLPLCVLLGSGALGGLSGSSLPWGSKITVFVFCPTRS